MKVVKEFKEFAMKGNMMDLAVGIIIGGAFGKVVSSMVSDLLMPPLGLLIGGINFTDIKLPLKDPVVDGTGKTLQEAVTLNLGNFIQSLVDFTIIAFAVFLLVKAINAMRRRTEEAAPTPPPTRQEELLSEIRDLLKRK